MQGLRHASSAAPKKFRATIFPGDGIGPEIAQAVVTIFEVGGDVIDCFCWGNGLVMCTRTCGVSPGVGLAQCFQGSLPAGVTWCCNKRALQHFPACACMLAGSEGTN